MEVVAVTATVLLLLERKLPEPLYLARIVWLPTGNRVVVNDAVPVDDTEKLPRSLLVVVSMKSTLPAVAFTVAVSVNAWPKLMVLVEATRVVLVLVEPELTVTQWWSWTRWCNRWCPSA